MKRLRVQILGFGCAVFAASAAGADDPWRTAGPPAARPAAPAAVEPAPVRPAPAPPAPVVPRPVAVTPAAAPVAVAPEWQPIAPRVGFATPDAPRERPRTLPAPTAPAAAERPEVPAPIAAGPAVLPPIPVAAPVQDETTRPRIRQDELPRMQIPVAPPRDFLAPQTLPPMQPQPQPKMTPPEPPGLPPQTLPQPQPLTPPTANHDELPVAPADLMVPAGVPVPGQHGTFGSKPINISRDFPTFFADGIRERAGLATGLYPGGNRGFVQAEYLMWWATPLQIPLLGTTNTMGGQGFVGEPGTEQILGPGQIIGPFRNGVRVRAGTWLGNGCGIDGSFFYLPQKSTDIVRTSDQFGVITRPVFSPNPVPGGGVIGNTGEAVTVPGVLTGSLLARAESVIYGFDANIRKCLHTCCDWHAEWFFGYRNVSMEESLSITENILVVGRSPGVAVPDPPGTTVFVRDTFATNNYFHGVQIGGLYERQWGRFSVSGRASVGLGVTRQEVNIDGFQVRTRPGMAPMTFNGGGLLAAGPNIGNFTNNEFSVVSELTINFGYRVTPAFRVYAGYNFLYWSNVVRPGDQIDGVVDLTFVPNGPPVTPSGLNRPMVPFKQSDMFISGVQFGAEWRW